MLSRTELGRLQAGFSKIARSTPCSVRFIDSRMKKRKVEHRMLGSFARLRDRWRRVGKQPAGALTIPKIQDDARGNRLEKVNEDLRAAEAELQRRWKYLAEAQRLSRSGTFGWKVN